MTRVDVVPRLEHDATNGFAAVGGLHETNNRRTLALLIRPEGTHFRLFIQTDDPKLEALFGDQLDHELPLTTSKLLGAVQSCRNTWNECLVHMECGNSKPFQQDWDMQSYGPLLEQAMPELALAGAKLFRTLFFPRDAGDPELHRGLRPIGGALREAMAMESRWLKVSSKGFHVPWGLIYSGALNLDGTDWEPEGFWGYQHMIENAPLGKGGMQYELTVPEDGNLVVSLQLDESIDQQMNVPCNEPVETLMTRYGQRVTTRRRNTRRRLAEALRQGDLDEQVLFFCCHAVVDGVSTQIRADEAYLVLSDRSPDPRKDRVTPSDIQEWIDLRSFYDNGNRPLVFLNACGSGQLNSIFYPSFGEIFLALGASSVLGAQVELPGIFAGEFARRFFERFFAGGTNNQVGKILFELRREFLQTYRNPLGLIYSLFRGADVFLTHGIDPAP